MEYNTLMRETLQKVREYEAARKPFGFQSTLDYVEVNRHAEISMCTLFTLLEGVDVEEARAFAVLVEVERYELERLPFGYQSTLNYIAPQMREEYKEVVKNMEENI